ncbi:RHS repeat-associated core domain-containing protein [Patescibacteria group bacterium]|nr:RHS repeat-associated core domain-containing protein [Patescibacteria group bacterium]
MRKAILFIILLFLPLINVKAFEPTYKFTDQPQDSFGNLYDYSGRVYDPEIGRFIQPDPLQNFLVTPELEKRSKKNLEEILSNPQMLNIYSYALNNPVNVVDPTGEVPKERQERFNKISDYIRNNEDYWLIRDCDGNAKAIDAIWQKSLELTDNNIKKALDTFYDALHIDWAHQKTLDSSEKEFRERLNNLPSSLAGEYGGSYTIRDKLQHFAASARLAYKYGKRIAGLLGRLKEVKDGFRALFSKNPSYSQLRTADEGYSVGDVYANQVGIQWIGEYKQAGIMPSQVINSHLY